MRLDEAKQILKKNGYLVEGEGMSKTTINKRIIADIRLQLIKRGWSFIMADDYVSNNSKRLLNIYHAVAEELNTNNPQEIYDEVIRIIEE